MDRVSYATSGPGNVIVVLEGEQELYGATKLEQTFDTAFAEAASITVDLRRAEFIDSTVVGVLLDAQRRADAHGIDYTIVVGDSTGEPVRRMLEVTGLQRILPVVERATS